MHLVGEADVVALGRVFTPEMGWFPARFSVALGVGKRLKMAPSELLNHARMLIQGPLFWG